MHRPTPTAIVSSPWTLRRALSAFALCALSLATAAFAIPTPQLHTDQTDGTVRDPSGNRVVLRGVGIRPSTQFGSARSIENIEWATDGSPDPTHNLDGHFTRVVRLVMNSFQYNGDSSIKGFSPNFNVQNFKNYFNSYVVPSIQRCRDLGVYCIVDVHYQGRYSPSQSGMAMTQLEQIWQFLATHAEVQNKPYVWLELFNEPICPDTYASYDAYVNAVPGAARWTNFKNWIQPLVTKIRQWGATDNVIVVGSSGWDQDFKGISLANSVSGNLGGTLPHHNIVYTYHLYPHGRTAFAGDATFNSGDKGGDDLMNSTTMPAILTEFSWTYQSGEELQHGTTTDWGQPLRNYLDGVAGSNFPANPQRSRVGWTAWAFSPEFTPSLLVRFPGSSTALGTPIYMNGSSASSISSPEHYGRFVFKWLQDKRYSDLPGTSTNSVPAIVTTSLANATVGLPYAKSLSATGGNGTLVWTKTTGTLPAGIVLPSDGTLSGTPTATGVSSFTVKLADSDAVTGAADEDTQILNLTVDPNASVPVITSGSPLPNGTKGTAYSQALVGTGGNGARVWSLLSGVSLPPGLALSSGGVVSGTPTVAGSFTFGVKLADSDTTTGPSDEDTAEFTISVNGTAGTGTVGAFTSQDIGAPGLVGAASLSGSTYTVTGGGTDIWGTADKFRLLHKPVSGNQRIVARVIAQQDTHPWAKAGIMLRESTGTGAIHATVALSPDNGVQFLHRATTGAAAVSDAIVNDMAIPLWLRLDRRGSIFNAYESPNGSAWTLVGSATFAMTSGMIGGLAVSSHDNALLNTSAFDNVAIAALPSWTGADIGTTGAAGSQTTDWTNDVIAISGAGANIWSTADAFRYFYHAWTADGEFVVQVGSLENTHAFAKAGIMFRQGTAANAPHVTIDITPNSGIELLARASTGALTTSTVLSGVAAPRYLKLTRTGNAFKAYYSDDGDVWTQVGATQTVAMTGTLNVGLVVCSHVAGTLATATFTVPYFK